MITNITAAEKLACVERELRQRNRVYPRLVSAGKMTERQAFQEIALMECIANDYRRQVEADPQGNGRLI